MKQNEKIVFASSIFEETPVKKVHKSVIEKKVHKNATVKKCTVAVETYHETYY